MKEKINKIFIIFLVFLLFLFNICFASSGTFTVSNINGESVSLPNFDYLLAENNKTDYFVCYDPNAGCIILRMFNATSDFEYCYSYPVLCFDQYLTKYKLENNSWSLIIKDDRFSNGRCALSCTIDQVYLSSRNIYDQDTGELLFPLPVVEQVTIPALEKVEEIPQAMSQTMRILIPIGLVVLSIGLLVYLIRYLIFMSL